MSQAGNLTRPIRRRLIQKLIDDVEAVNLLMRQRKDRRLEPRLRRARMHVAGRGDPTIQ